MQVTGKHRKDQWGLDDVLLHSQARNVHVRKIKDVRGEGVNQSPIGFLISLTPIDERVGRRAKVFVPV